MTQGMELLLQEFLRHKFETHDQANEPEGCVKALLFNTEMGMYHNGIDADLRMLSSLILRPEVLIHLVFNKIVHSIRPMDT
jgi:hypothetical protein